MMIPVIFLSNIQVFSFVKLWRLPGLPKQRAPVHLLTYFSLPSLSLSLSILCNLFLLGQWPDISGVFARISACLSQNKGEMVEGLWQMWMFGCTRVCVGVPFHLCKGRWFPFWWVLGVGWRIRGSAPSGWPALRNPHIKKLRSQFLNMRIVFLIEEEKIFFSSRNWVSVSGNDEKIFISPRNGHKSANEIFSGIFFPLEKALFRTCPHTCVYMCPQTWTARQPRRCSPDYSGCVCEHALVNNILHRTMHVSQSLAAALLQVKRPRQYHFK